MADRGKASEKEQIKLSIKMFIELILSEIQLKTI